MLQSAITFIVNFLLIIAGLAASWLSALCWPDMVPTTGFFLGMMTMSLCSYLSLMVSRDA